MIKILFVVPYMFIPANSGNKNLTYNLLKYISIHTECDLVLLAEKGIDKEKIIDTIRYEFPQMKEIAVFEKIKGLLLISKMFNMVFRGYHHALARYSSKKLSSWLFKRVQNNTYDIVHFDMIHTAIYREFCQKVPTILVASDAYSMAAKNAALISTSVKSKTRGLIESFLLKNFEKAIYPNFNEVCTVSPSDTEYLSKISPASLVTTIGIAVSPEYINQGMNYSNCFYEKRILCVGNLDHKAIAEDIIYFLQNNLTMIREVYPGVAITILGKNPTNRLRRAMDEVIDLEHIDYVENYADFLNQNWIYVYPQRCGTGLQTKVQQAMAIGLPIVGYNISFTGLLVEDEKHCLICKNRDQMTNSVIKFLKDENLCREVGLSAAQNIKEKYSIDKIGRNMLEKYKYIITKQEK
jgi:polysaccharide biosynthesis protein PslH